MFTSCETVKKVADAVLVSSHTKALHTKRKVQVSAPWVTAVLPAAEFMVALA